MTTLSRIGKLLPPNLSGPLVALYSHTLIKRVAFGFLGIFEIIFLYEAFGHNFSSVLWYYLIVYGLYLLLVPLGAHLITQIGYRRSMMAAFLFVIIHFSIYVGVAFTWLPTYVLWAGTLAVVMYKTLYWLPYHVEFSEFTSRFNRGRYVAMIDSTVEILGIALPIISAFVITSFGYSALIFMALILALISLMPLSMLPEVREDFVFGYLETFKKLFTTDYRHELIAYLAEGIIDVASAIVWPVFIFLLLQGKYLEVGYVSAFILLVTVILRLLVGERSDIRGPSIYLRYGTVVSSVVWLVRAFVQSAYQIFLVGIFHNMADATIKTSWDTLWYQKNADRGHLVDEYTALREIGLQLGRIIAIVLTLILLTWLPLTITFILAAVSVWLLNLMSR